MRPIPRKSEQKKARELLMVKSESVWLTVSKLVPQGVTAPKCLPPLGAEHVGTSAWIALARRQQSRFAVTCRYSNNASTEIDHCRNERVSLTYPPIMQPPHRIDVYGGQSGTSTSDVSAAIASEVDRRIKERISAAISSLQSPYSFMQQQISPNSVLRCDGMPSPSAFDFPSAPKAEYFSTFSQHGHHQQVGHVSSVAFTPNELLLRQLISRGVQYSSP